VPGGTQRTILLSEEYESLQNGWIALEASGPDVVSFALLGNWKASILDGVPLMPALGRLLVFPEIQNESPQTTTFFLANPNVVPASVLLKWYDPAGSLLKSSLPIPIPPSGMYQSRISELFGPGSGGYVVAEVLTPEPIHAMELFGTQDAVAALLALRFDDGAGELYAAQLASSDRVRTILNLINTGTSSEEITLEAIAENGEVLATSDRILSSGAQLQLAAREIFNLESPTEGWVRIRSDSDRLLGAVTFQAPNGSWMAALPLQSQPAREFILSHVAHTPSIFTGVTLLNPAIEKTLVSFEVFDAEGQETGRSDLLLPAGCKKALLLNEWVPELDNQTGGFIRVRSTRGLLGFELFGSYTLDYVSAVPQQVTVH
jgi:hypothetical protein